MVSSAPKPLFRLVPKWSKTRYLPRYLKDINVVDVNNLFLLLESSYVQSYLGAALQLVKLITN